MPQQSEAKHLCYLTEVPGGWPLATVIDAFVHLASFRPDYGPAARARAPSCSESGAPKNPELLRAVPRNSEHSERLGRAASSERVVFKGVRNFASQIVAPAQSLPSPELQSSQPIRITPSTPSSVLELQARKGLPKTACGFASQIGAPTQSLQARKGLPKKAYKFVSQIGAPTQSLPSPELQALLSPHNSTACGQQSPLLRASEVKNSEWRAQIAPASAVCGELGLPSLERETARLGPGQTNDRNDWPPARPKKINK